MFARGLGLSIRQPRREWRAIGVGGVAREFGVVGQGEALLDDRGVQARGGGDHARVVLRERDDEQAFAFELLRGLAEPPRVVDELADVVRPASARTWSTASSTPAVAVVDRDADVQGLR